MSNTNKFSTASLDFDQIKGDLKRFLKTQKEFSDYDFEGSGLSTLINLLAFNTHYNNVYDNFAINESFLDTAVKRSSVISHANILNYVPRSYKSAMAKIDITITDTSTNAKDIITIPAFTAFSSKVGEKVYTFYTKSDISAKREGSIYEFKDVAIYEGSFIRQRSEFTGDYFQTFKLDNMQIDTDSIVVKVDEQTETNVFVKANDIVRTDGNSKVYFLKMNSDNTYQVQFGNGVIGQSLKSGDIVEITYIICNGSVVNGVRNFTIDSTIAGNLNVQILCTQSASGGAEAESTDSIRLNAPKLYTTQNRLITESDYQHTISAMFANARCVKVWGGEKMDPPQYGKVFISIITKSGMKLSNAEKHYIENEILKPRRELTKLVEFVDPSYILIQVISTVYYNPNKTIKDITDIQTIVQNAILDYNEKNLGDFGDILQFSKLSSAIDDAEDSITNNSTKINLFVDVEPTYDYNARYTIKLNNSIYKPKVASESVMSEGFYCMDNTATPHYIDDDPVTGRLRLFYKNALNEKVFVRDIGTIDYEKGILDILDLNIVKLNGEKLRIMIIPENTDILSSQNQFATIDPNLLKIAIVPTQENLGASK